MVNPSSSRFHLLAASALLLRIILGRTLRCVCGDSVIVLYVPSEIYKTDLMKLNELTYIHTVFTPINAAACIYFFHTAIGGQPLLESGDCSQTRYPPRT